MLYKYQVRDKQGKNLGGTVEASSLKDAVKLLRQRDFFIVNIKEAGGFDLSEAKFNFSRVSFNDIVNFTRQLATMISAGLPLLDSLSLLRNQAANQAFKELLGDVLKKIEGGDNLSNALEKHQRHFNKIYVSIIRAGETSGKLDVVLQRLADNLDKEREFRGKIRGAMIYPTIIVIAMLTIGFLMMTFVVPKMTEFFKEFNVELPLPTRILIFISDILSNYWWLVIGVIFGLGFLFVSWRKTEGGRAFWDRILLKLPIWGILKKQMILTEMTRTMALLIGAGVPILESLSIVSEAVESPLYSYAIHESAEKVEKGFPLGVSFINNSLFPPFLGQMITVGEETGKMDETLFRVSHFFEVEANERVKILTTALEPIIMVVLGIGVAFLVLSIVLPMYQLTQSI